MKNDDKDRLSRAIDDLANGQEPSELDEKTVSLLKRLKGFYNAPTPDESFKVNLEKKLLKELEGLKTKNRSILQLFWFNALSALGISKGHSSWMYRRLALGMSAALILITASLAWYATGSWRTPSAYELLLETQMAMENLPAGKVLYEKRRVYSAIPDGEESKEIIVERWVRESDQMIVAKVLDEAVASEMDTSIDDSSRDLIAQKPAPLREEVAEKKSAPAPRSLRSTDESRSGGEGMASALDSLAGRQEAKEGPAFEDSSPQEENEIVAAPVVEEEPIPEVADMTPAATPPPSLTLKEAVTEIIAKGDQNITIIGREEMGKDQVIVIEWKPDPEIITKIYISSDSHLPLRMRLESVENDGSRRIVRSEDIIDRKIIDALDLPQEFWETGTLPATSPSDSPSRLGKD